MNKKEIIEFLYHGLGLLDLENEISFGELREIDKFLSKLKDNE